MRKKKAHSSLMPALHPLSLLSFEGTDKYTLFKLECSNVQFPLFSAPIALRKEVLESGQNPLSLFSLTAKLPERLTARWLQAVFYDCNQDHVFSAKIYISQKLETTTVLELPIKPSDALLLSLSEHIPLYCTDELAGQLSRRFAAVNS